MKVLRWSSWRVCATLFILVAVFPLRSVVANRAADAVVVENEIRSNYPLSLTFRLGLAADTAVDTVALIFSTDQRNCAESSARHPVEVKTGSTLTAEWKLEFKRAAPLPPGATLFWEWEIRLKDGTITRTPRRTYTLVDERLTWHTLSRGDVSVNWSQGDNSFGQFLLDQTVAALANASRLYGVTMSTPTRVWIYPDAKYLDDILWTAPDWTGGVALPDSGASLIGIAPSQREWAKNVLPHEITHLVIDQRLLNCSNAHLPTWLNEGLAVVAEPDLPSDINAMLDAVRAGKLDSLRALANGFAGDGQLARLSYTYGGEVARYLVTTQGPKKLDVLFSEVKSGTDIDNALISAFGFDTDGLDQRWRASVGLPSQPVSVAATATPVPRPTVAPTLPLYSVPVAATATRPATAVAQAATIVASATPVPPPPTVAPTPTGVPAPTSLPTAPPVGIAPFALCGGALVVVVLAGLGLALLLRARARRTS